MSLIVLGDVGRSPRMQYHALALAAERADVSIVGYAGSALWPEMQVHRHIRCALLPPRLRSQRRANARLAFLFGGMVKVLRELGQLLWLLLWRLPRPEVVLVQNPPAIPTLAVGWLVARLHRARFVIDWHNLGYAMLALRLGPHHPVVGLARWCEGFFGRRADTNLCVSRAMQDKLLRWGLAEVRLLYDRPSPRFAPTPLSVQHRLWLRLQDGLAYPTGPEREIASSQQTTIMTQLRCEGSGSVVKLRADRPALIISPTSWTADEDFDLLLDASVRCEAIIQSRASCQTGPFPRLLLLLTGRGPGRAHYEAQFKQLALSHIMVRTLWLEPEDYPLVLGSADLGLCLHRSASGLDLPMKIMDMLGSGVPVCALNYAPCLAEQLHHGENGLLFQTSEELAQCLYDLFCLFPHQTLQLNELRRQISHESGRLRRDAWQQVVCQICPA